MKKLICMGICMLALLLPLCADAQEYVSIAEVFKQAQAMGGVWQETFDTPNGKMTVDAPIIVPDVETMPVMTMEGSKISEDLYHHIINGKKIGDIADDILYEAELGGKSREFFLGRENDYVNQKKTNIVGYDAVDMLWIQHGMFRYGLWNSDITESEPTTYHFPWEIDPDQPSLRNSSLTLNEAMRLWKEELDTCFPEDDFILQPKTIAVYGSTLTDKTGKGKAYENTGHYEIYAEQLIDGVPLLGGIMYDLGLSPYKSFSETNPKTDISRTVEKLNKKYGTGVASVLSYFGIRAYFMDEESYVTFTDTLARVRTVEYDDIPLASLDSVLESIRKEIEAGNIRQVHSVRLGYVLYSNPDMTDHAWAIPRWVVSALYVTQKNQKDYEREQQLNAKHGYEYPLWGELYSAELLVDAQSNEMNLFYLGDDEVYSVPKITTWDKVK